MFCTVIFSAENVSTPPETFWSTATHHNHIIMLMYVTIITIIVNR